MNRTPRMSVVVATVLVLLSVGLAACGGDPEAEEQAGRQARLAELQEHKGELDAAREELAQMEERLEQAQVAELPEGEEVDVTELQSEIDLLDSDITTMAEELNAALVEFINAKPPIEGEPLTEVQKAAFDLKAEEDMALAREYITEGGDYARAIRIYQDILRYAPDNERVQEALAEAEAQRYMDQDRFSQVEEDMTQEEVEDLLGPVNLRNRREFPEQEVVAWYYPKSKARDAAGVFFRKKDDRWIVYRADFDAITKDGEGGES